MQSRELKQVLFEAWGDLDRPLFASQRELARRIVDESRYEKPQALAAFISQILLGHRPCPGELAEEIVAVARKAASDQGQEKVADLVAERLHSALRPDASVQERLIDEIYFRQVRAREVIIVNPTTLEGHGHSRSGDFQTAMFDALLDNEGLEPARYVFVLDRELQQEAVLHWKRTLDGLTARIADAQPEVEAKDVAKDTLSRLNSERQLLVVGVERSLCIVPMVAFDPQGEHEDCELYVWDTHVEADADGEGIARLSRFVKRKWLNDFYGRVLFPLTERPTGDPLSITNVEFKSVERRL